MSVQTFLVGQLSKIVEATVSYKNCLTPVFIFEMGVFVTNEIVTFFIYFPCNIFMLLTQHVL